MLEIKCDDHYKRVVEFAEKKGLRKQLDERIDYLRKYADPEEKGLCKVELRKDFAPASFAVDWFKRTTTGEYVHWFNGGCIFRGDQTGWDDKGLYVDPLSVELVANPHNAWSIDT